MSLNNSPGDYDEEAAEKIQANLGTLYHDVDLLRRLIGRLETDIQHQKGELASLCLSTRTGHQWERDFDGYPCDGTVYNCVKCYSSSRG